MSAATALALALVLLAVSAVLAGCGNSAGDAQQPAPGSPSPDGPASGAGPEVPDDLDAALEELALVDELSS